MNWITGIEVESRELFATFVDRGGNVGTAGLHELATVGIPTSAGLLRKDRITTNFQDWRIVPVTEYLVAHSASLRAAVQSRHQVYEFQVRQTKFQIPALVLMRALFYPGRHLLAKMFRPQGLDNSGFLDEDSLQLLQGLVRARGNGGYKWDSQAVRSRLQWMYVYPSAYRMAHSIHEHAMRGGIGITLPAATIQAVVTGKKVGDTYYVTDLAIKKIEPQERAFGHLRAAPAEANPDRERSSTLENLLPDNVYSSLLTDEEWEAIQPILVPRSMGRCIHSQRDLLDAVLFKLQTGTPWRKILYKSGTYKNATHAYRVWKERGTFGPALERLQMMRYPA